MDATGWIIVAAVIAVVVIVVLLLAIAARRRRRHHLQTQFGAEYGRSVDAHGRRRQAERDLAGRAERREQLDIRPLSSAARDRYAEQWRTVQSGFVDRPESSVGQADALVGEVMRERGYPVDDFNEQVDLVSVDYPDIVDDYRVAHSIAERNEHREASTDDLRVAVVRYRSLFEALLEDDRQGIGAERAAP